MTIQAVQDRIKFVQIMRYIQPALAEDEANDLQGDFLRQVIAELPGSELAAKARLILKLEEDMPLLVISHI